ncbi:DOT1-domain-containing protein [Meredithblackwellia eburnea MCA 4105]
MFSSNKLKKTVTTTTTTTGTPQSRPRQPVKVATITRTTIIKKHVPPPPRPPPTAQSSTSSPAKRKQQELLPNKKASTSKHREQPSAKKTRTTANGNGNANRNKSKSSSSEEDDASGSETSSSDGDGDRGKPCAPSRRKATDAIVDRDCLSELDGTGVTCISGEKLVLDNRKAYLDYFVDLANPESSPEEWCGEQVPTVTLEYPAVNASERFALLMPKDGGNEYDPIEDVMNTIRFILDFFLTPSQALSLFGHVAGSNSSFSAFLSAPPSRSATPSTPTESTIPNATTTATATSNAASVSPAAPPLPPLMRTLEKAKSKRDGPTFLSTIARFNSSLLALKSTGAIADNIKHNMKGVPDKLWTHVTAQAYARAVGPEVEGLAKYEAFSSNTYGELLPKFVGEICGLTGLGPDSVFVDLGSGVGNCVVQAALATGCEAWGFENMAHASHLARIQVAEAEGRFRMWGLSSGQMKVVEADFCKTPEVNRVLQRADVVLVNNEVFSAGLNQSLSLLFLDLRQSTRVVSLKAFASSFTLSAYNQHSPLAILNQGAERHYGSKSVSWKAEGGTYFIGKIDRNLLMKWKAKEKRKQEARAAAAATSAAASSTSAAESST